MNNNLNYSYIETYFDGVVSDDRNFLLDGNWNICDYLLDDAWQLENDNFLLHKVDKKGKYLVMSKTDIRDLCEYIKKNYDELANNYFEE